MTAYDKTGYITAVQFNRSGPYSIGSIVEVLVIFHQVANVTVTGTPQLELDIGGQPRQADYQPAPSLTTSHFWYRVAENDLDTNGVSIGTNKLTLSGGAITKADGTPGGVLLTHPAVPDDADQKVDGVRPTPQSAATSTNGSEITITFSENLLALGPSLAELFTLKVSGSQVPNGIAVGATRGGNTAILTLASPVTVGETVTVSYEDTTTEEDGLAVQDVLGNDADSFDDFPVTNNALHIITIAAGTSPVTEGTAATFTLTRNGTPATDLPVNVTVTQAGDFISGTAPTSVTFTGSNTTVTLTVTTHDDAPDEPDGSVTATVTGSTTYFVGPDSSDTVIVQDNDVVPEPPRHFTARSGHEKVQLYWDAPAERAVDKYQFRYRRSDSATWIKNWTDIPGGDTNTRHHTVESLTNEVEYRFELRAVNSAGNGRVAWTTATPGRVVLREPARISEGQTSTLTITPRDTPFDTDQTLTLVLAGDYAPHVAPRPIAGQDFTVSLAASDTQLTPQMLTLQDAGSYTGQQPHYTITLPANQESVAVKVTAIDDEPETTEEMVVWVFRNGRHINREPDSSDFLFIRASDPSPEATSGTMGGNTATVTFNRAIKRIDYEPDEHNDNPPAEETAFLLFTGQNPPTFEGPNNLPTPATGQPGGVYAEYFSASGNTLSVTFPLWITGNTRAWLVYDKIRPDGPLGDGSGSPYGHDVGRFIIQVAGPS